MDNTLLIHGCGGHARSVIDIASLTGWKDIILIDENSKPGEMILGHPVYPKPNLSIYKEHSFFIAIGDNYQREERAKRYLGLGMKLITIISPHTHVSCSARLDDGVFIGNFVHIGPEAIIGENSIINTHAIIEHECQIGNFTHIAIGAHIAGRVSIGAHCLVGAGSTIRDGISIEDDVIIGAGAVVVKDIRDHGVYTGIPARRIE